MYYRLHQHCKLIQGAARGAIYNLQTGKVYSVNRRAVELLLACDNTTLENCLDISSPDTQPLVDFLDRLTALDAGGIYINHIPKSESNPPLAETSEKINFLWIEVTSKCNNRCLHCYASSGPFVEQDSVPHERWLSLISEARQEGATAIQLIGGEPLMYQGWQDLVQKACEEDYQFIEIFTNAILIKDSTVDFFKRYGVSIATTIYADNAEKHDQVTGHPGSFDKTITAIKMLLAAGIPLRIASIIMKTNEHEAPKIMQLLSELGVEPTPPDVIRPTGRGNDADLLPTAYAKPPIQPPFHTDEYSFMKAQQFNSCLTGKIAVTTTGDVIPCIFARNQICGNILTASLADIINGQSLQKCWHTTKDQIEKCKDCEYRYACTDCRPLAAGTDPEKRWLACTAGCSYNPYTGTWTGDK